MGFNPGKPKQQRELGEFTLVSIYDPSIDKEECDVSTESDYQQSYDASLLKFLPDQQPTVFHCRPLTLKERTKARNLAIGFDHDGGIHNASGLAALDVFQIAVKRIENFVNDDGTERFDPNKHVQRGNPPRIKQAWLDESGLPDEVFQEIGAQILKMSQLSEDDAKNSSSPLQS